MLTVLSFIVFWSVFSVSIGKGGNVVVAVHVAAVLIGCSNWASGPVGK